MAIPISITHAKLACENLFNEAMQVEALVTQAVLACQNGPVAVPYLVQVMGTLGAIQANWASYANVPGLNAYAQMALGQSNFDATTEAINVITAANAVVSWLKTNLPQDANGNIQLGTVNATGGIVNPTMNANQLTSLVPLLQAVQGCFS